MLSPSIASFSSDYRFRLDACSPHPSYAPFIQPLHDIRHIAEMAAQVLFASESLHKHAAVSRFWLDNPHKRLNKTQERNSNMLLSALLDAILVTLWA